ncbi:hypothetical protein [Polaromonas sp. JS666]|uniref:hypothetical protein n=1 Tax=Polaromonas sp. (strain JS666 / ATCC BAA-500) TaxID=296591 RepID=UPI00088ADC63|nr:hypothetical protein [Polaromonas sp. JS666]SDN13329.1 hypothetical protein SAMN05720382_103505 [Polaromonas sp. JS666]
MSHSTLVNAQLKVPLRSLALTVEEPAPGEFCWRILESREDPRVFESISCSDITFAAYDTALATGYGELQRLVGPDLQYGPRSEEDLQAELFVAPAAKAAEGGSDKRGSVNGFKPGPVPA